MNPPEQELFTPKLSNRRDSQFKTDLHTQKFNLNISGHATILKSNRSLSKRSEHFSPRNEIKYASECKLGKLCSKGDNSIAYTKSYCPDQSNGRIEKAFEAFGGPKK